METVRWQTVRSRVAAVTLKADAKWKKNTPFSSFHRQSVSFNVKTRTLYSCKRNDEHFHQQNTYKKNLSENIIANNIIGTVRGKFKILIHSSTHCIYGYYDIITE